MRQLHAVVLGVDSLLRPEHDGGVRGQTPTMTTAALDYSLEFEAPTRIVPVVLIAGVPLVLVPAGCNPTQTTVTSGSVDSAWWPGAGALVYGIPDPETEGTLYVNPVRDWLDLSTVWSTVEQARPLEGDVRVEALRFDLFDVGDVTAAISAREARVGQYLAADVTDLATTIPVETLAGIPSTGIAHAGREAIIYDATGTMGGVSSIRLVGGLARRGAFGSRASVHRAPRERRPLVTVGPLPRHWQGRRAVLFFAKLSDDGSTLIDPTPVYMGTALAGVRLTSEVTRWQIPLDPITETATRKFSQRTVMLAGIQWLNGTPGPGQPLRVGPFAIGPSYRNGRTFDGPAEFVGIWNRYMIAHPGAGATAVLDVDGRVRLEFAPGFDATLEHVHAAWDTPGVFDSGRTVSSTTWLSTNPLPSTSLALDGRIAVSATDLAQIPTTGAAVLDPSPGRAVYTLTADTATTKGVVATIDAIDAVNNVLTVTAILPPDPNWDRLAYLRREAVTQVSKATPAVVGILARGDHALGALRALVRAVDGLDGGGLEEDSIDWTHLAAQMARIPLGNIPEAREYRATGDDTLLSILVDELRLRGMTMAMRRGRITGVRFADYASTELAVATIDEGDILLDDNDPPAPLPIETTDNTEPLASGITFALPDGGSFAWVDSTALDDFGSGARIETQALRHLLEGFPASTLAVTLQGVAQQLLGVLSEPSRFFRLPLPASFLGLMPGDVVRLTHSQLPDWAGNRGLVGAVAQVFDMERRVFGDTAQALVRVRLSAADVAGYAPEFLVAAGGITMSTITADVSTPFGPTCFADPDSGDVLDGLEVGDHVVLSEYDALTPTADSAYFTITAINRGAHTITLDANPGTTWATLAASAMKVVVRFAGYGDATERQRHGFAYTADPATQVLGGSDPPDRWAA